MGQGAWRRAWRTAWDALFPHAPSASCPAPGIPPQLLTQVETACAPNPLSSCASLSQAAHASDTAAAVPLTHFTPTAPTACSEGPQHADRGSVPHIPTHAHQRIHATCAHRHRRPYTSCRLPSPWPHAPHTAWIQPSCQHRRLSTSGAGTSAQASHHITTGTSPHQWLQHSCQHRHLTTSAAAQGDMDAFMRLKRAGKASQAGQPHSQQAKGSPQHQHQHHGTSRHPSNPSSRPDPYLDTRLFFEELTGYQTGRKGNRSGGGGGSGGSGGRAARRPAHHPAEPHSQKDGRHMSAGSAQAAGAGAGEQQRQQQAQWQQRHQLRQQQGQQAQQAQRQHSQAQGLGGSETGANKRRRRKWVRRDAWWRRVGWEDAGGNSEEEDEEEEGGEEWEAWAGGGRPRAARRKARSHVDDESWYAEYLAQLKREQQHGGAYSSAGAAAGGANVGGMGGGSSAGNWWAHEEQRYSQHQQDRQYERHTQYTQYSQRVSGWWERYQRASSAGAAFGTRVGPGAGARAGAAGDGKGGGAWGGGGAGAGGGPRHSVAVVGHLATLGLGPSVVLQAAQLKEAFHRCAKQWHPDRHGACGVHEEAAAADKFKEARAAYEALRAMC